MCRGTGAAGASAPPLPPPETFLSSCLSAARTRTRFGEGCCLIGILDRPRDPEGVYACFLRFAQMHSSRRPRWVLQTEKNPQMLVSRLTGGTPCTKCRDHRNFVPRTSAPPLCRSACALITPWISSRTFSSTLVHSHSGFSISHP